MSSLGDSLGYLLFGNPVSQAVINTAAGVARSTGIISKQSNVVAKTSGQTAKMVSNALPLWRLAGKNYNFIRLAGISGAAAVIVGAIGSHKSSVQEKVELRNIFETANRFHFFHSLALMAVPLCKRPLLTGTLMFTGTVIFSGALYYRAFTNKKTFTSVAPFGGFCLIFAWITLIF